LKESSQGILLLPSLSSYNHGSNFNWAFCGLSIELLLCAQSAILNEQIISDFKLELNQETDLR